jgi:hypothetical protein
LLSFLLKNIDILSQGYLPSNVSQISSCLSTGGSVEVANLSRQSTQSIINLTIISSNVSNLGLSWIYLSFISGGDGFGASVDIPIPFTYVAASKTTIDSQGGLFHQVSASPLSVWPTIGRQIGDSLVTVRLFKDLVFSLGWTNTTTLAEIQVISFCNDSLFAGNRCLQQISTCTADIDCIQQLPLTSLQNNVAEDHVEIQYSTLPSVHSGLFLHFVLLRGNQNVTSAPRWNLLYVPNQIATIDRIVPSHSSIRGGTEVKIFISQIPASSFLDSFGVKFGESDANIISRSKWNSLNGTIITVQAPPYHEPGFLTVSVIGDPEQSISARFQYTPAEVIPIISMTPSKGSTTGGFSILLALPSSLKNSNTSGFFHVAIDGVYCPVRMLDMDYRFPQDDSMLISFEAPPHRSGPASVAVFMGSSLQYPIAFATSQFWYDSAISSFGVVETWSLIDRELDLAATNSLVAIKMTNCPSASNLHYSVDIAGSSCEPLRLDTLPFLQCVLFVYVPPSLPLGLTVASIVAQDYSAQTYEVEFILEVAKNASNAVFVESVLPSFGPTTGMNSIKLFLASTMDFQNMQDVQVLFGGSPGTVREISMEGGTAVLFITVPPCLLDCVTDNCTVEAEISCKSCSLDGSIFFDYTYKLLWPEIQSISRSSIPLLPGTSFVVKIQNFPMVSKSENVVVNWGGFSTNVPQDISLSTMEQTILLLKSPGGLSASGEQRRLTVLITPLVDGSKSVAFDVVLRQSGPALVSLNPAVGPCNGGFVIDVVLSDLNVADPLPARVFLNGADLTSTTKPLFISALGETGYSKISFSIPQDPLRPDGVVSISINSWVDNSAIVEFPVTLYSGATVKILSATPSLGYSGPGGTVVVLEVAFFSDEKNAINNLGIRLGTKTCNVLTSFQEGFHTYLSFVVPHGISPGLAKIFVLNSLNWEGDELDFLVLPSCRENSKSLHLYSSWIAPQVYSPLPCLEEKVQIMAPLVLMVDPPQGSTSGGSVLKIMCSGFWKQELRYEGDEIDLDKSEILVFIGDKLSKVVSLDFNGNLLIVNAEVPWADEAGPVICRILLPRYSSAAANFIFKYYNEPVESPKVAEVFPSAGLKGSSTSVFVKVRCSSESFLCVICITESFTEPACPQVKNWTPLDKNENVLIFDTGNFTRLYQPDIVSSDGDVGLVFLPDAAYPKSNIFFILRTEEPLWSVPQDLGFEWPQFLLSNLTFQWIVKEPAVSISSLFPSSADISVMLITCHTSFCNPLISEVCFICSWVLQGCYFGWEGWHGILFHSLQRISCLLAKLVAFQAE